MFGAPHVRMVDADGARASGLVMERRTAGPARVRAQIRRGAIDAGREMSEAQRLAVSEGMKR